MKHNPKILVVDDEEVVRSFLNASLDRLGYEVFLASDGREALDLIGENQVDVILADVKMPGLDGLELCRRLKSAEETRMIPVVMVTGFSELEDRIQALEAGADDFLSKPVHQAELQARVRSLVKVKAYHDHMQSQQEQLEAEVGRRTERLQKALARLKVASFETIYRLSQAAEYKDEETGAHIQRMSHYAAAVARKMGLGESSVEAILYAAPMHDVGKIGIPDYMLMKPGKLDPDEWEIMKQHTTIGAKILGGSDTGFIRLAEVIALTHHEKWDGSGYPKGLKGSKIPLAGRIVAIADVFDALTSDRPYRKAMSLEKSFDIIKEGRGSHFDSQVVDAFFAIEDRILWIRDKHPDECESLFVQMVGKVFS